MLGRLLCCAAPLTVLMALVSFFSAISAPGDSNFDWPQWQGQDRNAVSRETGLLQDWPKSGPPLLWKAEDLGGGFSTPSVAQGRVFGMGFRGNDEVVWAIDEKTGAEVWSVKTADANNKPGYNEGPRARQPWTGTVSMSLDSCRSRLSQNRERRRSVAQEPGQGIRGQGRPLGLQ